MNDLNDYVKFKKREKKMLEIYYNKRKGFYAFLIFQRLYPMIQDHPSLSFLLTPLDPKVNKDIENKKDKVDSILQKSIQINDNFKMELLK